MAKQAVYDYSTTPGSNSDIDGVDSSGATGKVKDGDNYSRSIMSHVKGFANDLGAVNTVGGTGNAITVTLSAAPSALVDGYRILFNASAANSGNTTLNVTPAGGSAFGAKKVLMWSAGSEIELPSGTIPAANALTEVVYDSAADGGNGAWMLHGSTPVSYLTNSQALAGTKTDAAANAANLGAFLLKGSDEASASTVSFGDGGFFHVTGTTTITDIDFDVATNGRAVDVVFDGVLTLTHNGTTLQLPGGANIVTAAGDRARFVQDNSDNVICLWYQRASFSNTGITLSTPRATTSGTTVELPATASIPAWAKRVTVTLDGVSLNSTSTLLLQLSAGGAFATSGYSSGGSTAGGTLVSSTSGFSLIGANQAQGDTHTGQIILTLADPSTNKWVASGLFYETGTARVQMMAGVVSLSGPLDQVRLNSVSGTATFDAGEANVSWE